MRSLQAAWPRALGLGHRAAIALTLTVTLGLPAAARAQVPAGPPGSSGGSAPGSAWSGYAPPPGWTGYAPQAGWSGYAPGPVATAPGLAPAPTTLRVAPGAAPRYVTVAPGVVAPGGATLPANAVVTRSGVVRRRFSPSYGWQGGANSAAYREFGSGRDVPLHKPWLPGSP